MRESEAEWESRLIQVAYANNSFEEMVYTSLH